ncbi:hypothetical protein DFH09DRAFT_1079659 [Mycena vulgaris]|nr:hypothetical protein DFH09DRAFT_1079659 [Mycena vulgaris]
MSKFWRVRATWELHGIKSKFIYYHINCATADAQLRKSSEGSVQALEARKGGTGLRPSRGRSAELDGTSAQIGRLCRRTVVTCNGETVFLSALYFNGQSPKFRGPS